MKLKENKVKQWNGAYKGVSFEIKNWKTEPNSIDINGRECWTYYLILHLARIPEECDPKSYWLKGKKNGSFINYNYFDHHVMCELDWHGGITWYSKERGFDGDDKVIKIGCDYSHYWDEGHVYFLDGVKEDVKNTIDRFISLIPNYKYWCCGNGKLCDLKDGLMKNDQFYSKEYWGDKDWYKELESKQ